MDEHRRRSLHHVIAQAIAMTRRRGWLLWHSGMISGRGLSLEREGDALVLRATNTAWWLGAIFGGFAVFWLLGWTDHLPYAPGGRAPDTRPFLVYWGGVLVGVAFVIIGLFLLLPREVNTIFDLRSRRVLHNFSFCKGLYERRRAYSFDEIAGLGVKEYGGEGNSYMPVMVLRGGKTRWLATINSRGYLAFADTIDEVCSATGLAKLDFPIQPHSRLKPVVVWRLVIGAVLLALLCILYVVPLLKQAMRAGGGN